MKALTLLPLLVLGACITVGPDYSQPEVAVPNTFRQDLGEWGPALGGAEATAINLVNWWAAFDDEVLAQLIERAVTENFDVHLAMSRIAEAEARLGVSKALRNPSLDLNAQYTRSGISENTQFGLFPGQKREQDSYQAGLAASWEVDLWGRAARSVEASSADLDMRVENLWAARVTLAGQVADAYLRLRELQLRTQLSQSNVEVLEQARKTAEVRYKAGLVQELDVLRASTDVESARAALPELRRLQAGVITELAILLAVQPGELYALLKVASGAATIPATAGRLGAQVPADLLRRRPDVRAKERMLAAETARIGVLTADLYPELNLLGSIGLQSEKPENLFKAGSVTHAIGPSLTMPLFSGGAIRENIQAQDERAKQALIEYESSVLTALHEVDGAATSIGWLAARLDATDRALAQAGLSLSRSETLYQEGLTTIDAVLDARRNLFGLQDTRAQIQSSLSRSYVDLFRALGGGWPVEDAPLPPKGEI